MSKGTRILLKQDVTAPNAADIIGNYLAELPSVAADEGSISFVPQDHPLYAKKRTHKQTEEKTKPRSYRLSKSVERRMLRAQRKLRGLTNQTTFVEAAIIAACRKLGV